MMEFCKRLKTWLHIHSFDKPLVSRYVSFNTRDIIYECKCGKRKVEREYRERTSFPIPTNHFMTNKEFQNILDNGNDTRMDNSVQ